MRHCYVLRVFTRGELGGNHLGVVTDVSGLSEPTMQTVATDLGFSETIFVDWRDGGVPQTRIFTPARELPFAGHPLVGAAWVLNVLGPGGVEKLACGAGDVSVSVIDDMVWVEAPTSDRPVRQCVLDVSEWVAPLAAFTVPMPLDYHMIQLSAPSDVAAAGLPDLAGDIYLWAWDGVNVKARFFAPEMGVMEDPATGSAAVALAAVFAETGTPTGTVEIRQGDEMGRPSTIQLVWSEENASIGGTVVHDEVVELDV